MWLKERISTGMKALSGLPVGGAYGNTTSGGLATYVQGLMTGTLPGATTNYAAEVGPYWSNNIVLSCVKWQTRQFPAAPPVVQSQDVDEKWQRVKGHTFPSLLDTPNRWYDGTLLWGSTLLSLDVAGNAYWYRLRSAAGKLAGFQYIPHWQIAPYWERDSAEPITGYAYRVDGKILKLPVGDVIHFRDTLLDPANPRLGLSPLGACLREMATDNEAATFAAALLRNMGVPGVIISPKAPVEELTPTQQKEYARLWREKFTGDRRGEPAVFGIPLQLDKLSFSPTELDFKAIRAIPEERITAALGIPAIVVGMGAGLERSTFANSDAAERWAWRHNIVPTQRLLAAQLSRDMGPPDPGTNPNGEGMLAEGQRVAFDNSNVEAMSEDEAQVYAMLTEAVGGPWLSPNEARSRQNLPPMDGKDELYPPRQAPPKPGADGEPAPAGARSNGRA